METFAIIPKAGAPVTIPGAGWAEFDQQGGVVFARCGKVFRGLLTRDGVREVELIDLNANRPPTKLSSDAAQLNGKPTGEG